MEKVRLLDVCDVYQPQTIATKSFVPDGKYVVYGANGAIGKYNDYNHKDAEVLMACRGATCGAINISQPYSWINGNAMVVKPNGTRPIDKKYLMYFLMSANKESIISGTAQPQITRQNLKEFRIALCTEEEQAYIVSRIEELFSSLDNAVEILNKTEKQLEVYRQAVLKEAFKHNESTEIVELQSIVDDIRIGPFGTMLHKSDYIDGGVPVINPQHIKSQEIHPSTRVSISERKADELSSYKLRINDVIMGRRGEMGRTAAVTTIEDGWICGTGSIIVRLKPEYDAVFYSQLLSSPDTVHYLEEKSAGTTMNNLNEDIVKHIPIPNITTKEQKKIREALDAKTSVCDNIEQTVNTALNEAEAMRQSILKEAFEGRL